MDCVSATAERLGLERSARKRAVELVVVDRVEKPTEN